MQWWGVGIRGDDRRGKIIFIKGGGGGGEKNQINPPTISLWTAALTAILTYVPTIPVLY